MLIQRFGLLGESPKRSDALRSAATSFAFWRHRSTSKPKASHSGDPGRRQSQKPRILATPVDVKAKSLALWRPRSTSKPNASHSGDPRRRQSQKPSILATPVDVKAKSIAFWRPRSTSTPKASRSGDPGRRQSQKPPTLAAPGLIFDIRTADKNMWRSYTSY